MSIAPDAAPVGGRGGGHGGDHGGGFAGPPRGPAGGLSAAPSAPAPVDAEPTEVRLVGVDAQVVSPAWELELLVTGIVLVGLFQIPPWLLGIWRHWEPHLTLAAAVSGRVVLQAAEAAVYALIICFVVALALRGFWVALVGVNVVFPHGVRWEKQREYGHIQTDIARQRVRPLPSFIGPANDAATLVFASGFVLAAGAVSSLGIVSVFLGVFALAGTFLPTKAAVVVLVALGAVFALLFYGAWAIDLRRGAALAPGSRGERTVRAVLRTVGGFTPDGVRSLGTVLTSNVNRRVAYAATALGMGGAFAVAILSVADGGDLPRASNYTYFAEDRRAAVVSPDLYESLHAPDASPLTLPSIQTDVVTDPYIRLFVPYRPDLENAALRRACPALQPPAVDRTAHGAAAVDSAVLACAAAAHPVTLDGRPAPGGRYRFFTNPRTERRGFLMLIPVATLAPGEHLLTVQTARRPTSSDTAPIQIPFWR